MRDDDLHDAFLYGMGVSRKMDDLRVVLEREGLRYEDYFNDVPPPPEPDAHGIKVPKSVWAIEHQMTDAIHYGVEYLDGTRETVGSLFRNECRSIEDAETKISAMYAAKGIDVRNMPGWKGNPTAEQKRAKQAEMDELMRQFQEKLRGQYDTVFEDILRGAKTVGGETYFYGMGEEVGTDRGRREQTQYGGRRQGKTASRPAPTPSSPERRKALTQLRAIKRLRDGTTYDGERNSAQARMDTIMHRHGIAEHEI